MIRDDEEAAAVLERLARSHENLIELFDSAGPTRSRLVAALDALLLGE